MGEKAFNNRLDILNSLNTDFQEDFGTRDSQSYMDTYSGSLKFMNSKDIDAFELQSVTPSISKLYDASKFSRSCLLAGRLVERGVRFVKVNLGGWVTMMQSMTSSLLTRRVWIMAFPLSLLI